MTNEVSIFNSGQLPAHLQGKTGATEAMITTGESLPRISIKGFQFTLRTKEKDQPLAPKGQHLDIVILAIDPPKAGLVGKAYFKDAYSGDAGDKPDCSSANGVYPDEWIEDKQATACASCPMNQWGAAVNAKGNKIKPCADHKRLIVVPKDAVDGDLAVIQVPPTSLKNMSHYGRLLLKHNAPLAGVVTRLSFDQSAEHPKLEFAAVEFLDEVTAAKAIERADSQELQDVLHLAAEPPAEQKTAASELIPMMSSEAEEGDAHVAAEPAAEPQKVMTAKAGGATYESFVAKGWTDELLIQHGYMELK